MMIPKRILGWNNKHVLPHSFTTEKISACFHKVKWNVIYIEEISIKSDAKKMKDYQLI